MVLRMGAAKDDAREAPIATGEESTATADVLRRVLAEIDRGQLPADQDDAAYLRGRAGRPPRRSPGCGRLTSPVFRLTR